MLGGTRVPDMGGTTVPCIVAVAGLGEALDGRASKTMVHPAPDPHTFRGNVAYLAPEITNTG